MNFLSMRITQHIHNTHRTAIGSKRALFMLEIFTFAIGLPTGVIST